MLTDKQMDRYANRHTDRWRLRECANEQQIDRMKTGKKIEAAVRYGAKRHEKI